MAETVSKSALKAKMLEHFCRVEETRTGLIVTDNSSTVLQSSPIRDRRSPAEVFAELRGRVVYRDDLLASTEEEWSEP